MRRGLAALVVAVLAATNLAGRDLSEIFPGPGSDGISEIGISELSQILDYGIERELMIFEVFNAVALRLEAVGDRARIAGDTLREAAESYNLGGTRVAMLLPIDKVSEVFLGRDGSELGGLEIFLEETHEVSMAGESAAFLEKTRVRLAKHYGFATVTPGMFEDGYGVTVRRLLLGFRMDSIENYGRNKIAIRVRGFSRPKRWRIDRIERLTE